MPPPSTVAAAPEPARPSIALRIGRIAPLDAAKFQAFLSIAGHRLTAHWRLVDDGHADVLVLDGHDAPTTPGLLDDPQLVLRIVDRRREADDRRWSLPRPLQYQDLVETLIEAEAALASGRLRLASPMAPRLSADESYRLTRWPPREMLTGDAQRLHLASLIVVRHMPLDELVRRATVSRVACSVFLAELGAAGLLDVQRKVAPPPARSRPVVAPTAPVPPSLFDKIRRRLGLRSAA